MTGTAEIVTAQRENVLLVPNAALRFVPAARPAAQKKSGTLLSAMLPRPPRQQARPSTAAPAKGEAQRVWMLRDGQPAPVAVTVGPTDGHMTEVTGGIEVGAQVITEMLSAPK
jgi:HlyD family secretion protein